MTDIPFFKYFPIAYLFYVQLWEISGHRVFPFVAWITDCVKIVINDSVGACCFWTNVRGYPLRGRVSEVIAFAGLSVYLELGFLVTTFC